MIFANSGTLLLLFTESSGKVQRLRQDLAKAMPGTSSDFELHNAQEVVHGCKRLSNCSSPGLVSRSFVDPYCRLEVFCCGFGLYK